MSMSKLVWKEYQKALETNDDLIDLLQEEQHAKEQIAAQAKDWKSRVGIIAKQRDEWRQKYLDLAERTGP